ncbi:MAG TPA: phage tail assembly chaperone [Thiopseudomonas sp.]|nr:phage tail assembly chaperone [Thiopseudomonas sp.]
MYATVDKDGHFTGVVYSEMTQNVQDWHDDMGFTWIVVEKNPEPIGEDGEYGKPTPEQLADTARHERDQLIESVRWRIERHSDELALGSEPTEPLEPLLQYVQLLRDVPQQAGFPSEIEWPQCP